MLPDLSRWGRCGGSLPRKRDGPTLGSVRVSTTQLVWLLLLSLWGCAAERRVVVVSLDGFRHDYATRAETPAFDRLEAEGARAGRLIPPWPSQTFPGHGTLATGVSPEVHGILNNRFYDRDRGEFAYADGGDWYDVDPLWVHLERQGLRAHVYHWVGSSGPREGVAASEWRPFAKVSDDERLAGVLDWLAQPPASRPRLVMSYWAGCDKPGHHDGPDSEAVTRCVVETDARIGRLLDALEAHPDAVTLLVVSDHGMTATVGEVNVVRALEATGARVVASGPIAHVYAESPEQLAKARAVAATLPHVEVLDPERRHPRRTGDFVVRASPGYRFSRKLKTLEGPPSLAGHHGHDPELPDMGAILYAWGEAVRSGARSEKAYALDVVPTVCALLGVPSPDGVEGRILQELFAP